MTEICARESLQRACAAALAVATLLAACNEAGGSDSGSASGSGVARHALIGPKLTACVEHLDCELVETACSSCCMPGAIATNRAAAFRTAFDDACSDYHGASCDCAPPDVVPRCVKGACAAVPRADAVECFSPTQNVWTAFEEDAVGCSCELDEPAACSSEGGLECTAMPTGTAAWHAVEDASCLPRKLADPAHSDDPEAVAVHLFVVPPNGPVAPIDVWIDDVHVVTGTFDYGPPGRDPGRIYEFDLSVIGPTISLRAEAPDATLDESIDVPAERWVVLEHEATEVLGVTVSNEPVGFD